VISYHGYSAAAAASDRLCLRTGTDTQKYLQEALGEAVGKLDVMVIDSGHGPEYQDFYNRVVSLTGIVPGRWPTRQSRAKSSPSQCYLADGNPYVRQREWLGRLAAAPHRDLRTRPLLRFPMDLCRACSEIHNSYFGDPVSLVKCQFYLSIVARACIRDLDDE